MELVKRKSLFKPLLFSLSLAAFISACGPANEDSKPNIVGGRDVGNNDQGPERWSTVGLNGCTGTIVAKDLILTAAHCYQNAVQGGYVLFGTKFNNSDRKIIRIEKASINPSYSGPHNDIAMLKLASEIPAGYKVVKMLPASIPLNRGDTVRQAGYGSNNEPNSFGTLRTVDSKFVSMSRNGSIYVENGKTAACSGDSGGPLYVRKNNEWYTAGVTSTAYMDLNRRCTGGNYYSSVGANYDLILEMGRKLTGRQEPFADAENPDSQPDSNDGSGDETLPSGEAKFQLLSQLTKSGPKLSIRVKNISARPVENCVFTLTPVRSFFGFYEVSYDLKLLLPYAETDQEFNLQFHDSFDGIANLGSIKRYSISKTCQK